MFSLITVIIAIALAIALAVTALWFGGSAYNKGSAQAAAATIVNQGQQLLSATDLFYTDHKRYPNSLNELVTGGYLQSIPQPPEVLAANETFTANAQAASPFSGEWAQLDSGVPGYWMAQSVKEDVCRHINARVRGDNGIFRDALPSISTQCFGIQAPYTVLVIKPREPGLDLDALTTRLNSVGLMASANGGPWAVPPDSGNPGNGTPETGTGGGTSGYLVVGFSASDAYQLFYGGIELVNWGYMPQCPADAQMAPHTPTVLPTYEPFVNSLGVMNYRFGLNAGPGVWYDETDDFTKGYPAGQRRFCLPATEAEVLAANMAKGVPVVTLTPAGMAGSGAASITATGPASDIIVDGIVDGARVSLGGRTYFLFYAGLVPEVGAGMPYDNWSYNHFIGVQDVTSQNTVSLGGYYRNDQVGAGTVNLQFDSTCFPLSNDMTQRGDCAAW